MSDKRDDGGPAFPSPGISDATDTRHYQRDGMTLRDWFAGQAMIGLLANPNFQWDLASSYTPEENLMERAFAVADAALAARSKKP